MALNSTQLVTFRAALLAETDPTLVAYRNARNDTMVTAWCNEDSTADAWKTSVPRTDLFDATDVAKFANLTAGKRDAWKLLLDNSPVDATRNKIRKAVEDIWGATDGVTVLQGMVRKATRAENYLGGNSATTLTVTALKLNYTGSISTEDVGRALNG